MKSAGSEGCACLTRDGHSPRLFHELGFAIVKNNLAMEHRDFSLKAIRRQYERMLGAKIDGRYRLAAGAVIDPGRFDVLGRLYEDAARANGTRKRAGEFYTPPPVADYMIGLLELEKDAGHPDRKLVDIACGTGAFLVAGMRKVLRELNARGGIDAKSLRQAVDRFYGLDISPIAGDICRINLYLTLLNELGPEILAGAGGIRFNVFQADSIDQCVERGEDAAARIKRRLGAYRGGFDYVVGNPPYLEAKKMPARMKEACLASWPEIKGAFDLYIPFILQCNRLVSEGGRVCLILPDKFTVARYALPLRDTLLRDYSLTELADLSGTDVFDRAMVYPVVLAYDNRPPAKGHTVRTRYAVASLEGLAGNGSVAAVSQGLYRSVGHNHTLFCLPEKGDVAGLLERMFRQGKPIGGYVAFRSAVSFHKKGLRERFVRQSFDGETGPVLKYLGGRSYAKRNEVGLFGFRWEGYYINYDRTGLKAHHNVLPPLSNFTQEKIVLCQHAPRITAAYDGRGEFVTKDVYPIGIAGPGLGGSPFSLKYFTVLLNSDLMSFLYGIVYKGVQIGGGYYHYLPTWLDVLPVIAPRRRDIYRIEQLADDMISATDQAARLRSMREADEIVYRVYGISDEQRSIIRNAIPPRDSARR